MMKFCVAFCLLLSFPLLAQSADDRKTSLSGITVVGIQETGVAALGGGTAGSPYLLQAENAFSAAGIKVFGLDKATAAGLPIYNIHCTSMESGEQIRLACESRLLRHVFLSAAEDAKAVYAGVWTSPLIIASIPKENISDVEGLTQACIDPLLKAWKEANPSVAAPKKK